MKKLALIAKYLQDASQQVKLQVSMKLSRCVLRWLWLS